jgi:hypothetical protein
VASEQAAASTDRIPTDTLVAALEAIDTTGLRSPARPVG